MNIVDIKKILRAQKPFLREKYKVAEIGVFGSFIRHEERIDSDVDILVDFEGKIDLFDLLELEEYLVNLFGRKVDLVTRKTLKPYIGQRILAEVEVI
jgi:uncharacterized protein